jgi:hypothetical protein
MLDGFDPARKHGEERPFAALVGRTLPRQEADVGRRAGKPLTLGADRRTHLVDLALLLHAASVRWRRA